MASIELVRLLAELKKAASPVQRMKLVARAWRSVRGLAPGERRELAAHVGLEGAEELLERLASRGGSRLSPSLLLRALDRIRGTEPQEVSGVVDSLRDPRRRKELLRRGLEVLAPEPPPVEPVPVSVSEEPEPEKPPEKPPEKAEKQEPPRPAVPAAAPVVVPVVALPPPPAVVPIVVEAAPPVEQEPPEASPESDEGLIDRIEQVGSLTQRFRLLHRRLDHLRGLSPDQLGRLLELFPAGWQRRRTLAALLRAGIPETSQQAISLIELLESRRSQRWCASIMLDRWTLTPGERGALIERHGLFRRC